jgi:hypothetical protein
MKVFNAAGFAGRAAILAVVMTAALSGAASAAVTELTIDPTAQLSPGRLHAFVTGTLACDPGDTPSLSGQVIQSSGASGFGFATLPTCDGTAKPYMIDVGTGGGFPGGQSGIYKPGKASAQVTTTVCEPADPPLPFNCITTYTDAIIRLKK